VFGDAPLKAAVPTGDMVRVPAGPFIMGSDARWPDEGPNHEVYLPAYDIDAHEVTNEQYYKFMQATGRPAPSHFPDGQPPPGREKHPVVFVMWYDANDYCHWSGKRLPIDAEWEKAARGTDERLFPWGNEFDPKKANTHHSKRGTTTPVGMFPAGRSPYGAYDMAGNVWEWTASWYKPYAGNKRQTENYGQKYRVLKGGSFVDCTFYKCGISAPAFNRSFFKAETRNSGFGFRCAKSAESFE
jgi:iron(II)-dependent oxidoreductase